MRPQPFAPAEGGRAKPARAPKAGIDESSTPAYGGVVSLPVAPGPHRRAAVKIVDDRGIESLKIVEIEG